MGRDHLGHDARSVRGALSIDRPRALELHDNWCGITRAQISYTDAQRKRVRASRVLARLQEVDAVQL